MKFCVISTSTASDALASPFRDSCPKEAFSCSNSVVSQRVCRTRRALDSRMALLHEIAGDLPRVLHHLLREEVRREGLLDAGAACVLLVGEDSVDGGGVPLGSPRDRQDAPPGQFLDEQPDSDVVTLKDISRHFSYHPNYISTVLRKETGRKFTEILLEKRMGRASLLLKSTALPIEEISAMLGYSNHSNFYKAFKEYYGITQREYQHSKAT